MEHAQLRDSIVAAERRGDKESAHKILLQLMRQPGMTGKHARMLLDRTRVMHGLPVASPSVPTNR